MMITQKHLQDPLKQSSFIDGFMGSGFVLEQLKYFTAPCYRV